jgi:hypothetical protein
MSVFIHNFLITELENVATLMSYFALGILDRITRYLRLLLADLEVVE